MSILNTELSTGRATEQPRHRTAVGRFVVTLLVAGALATGLTGATTGRAEAASATTADAVVCFTAYMSWIGGYGIYNRPVNLEVWWNGAPAKTATYTPNTKGCISMVLPSGYYWRYRVAYCEYGAGCYAGQSNWIYAYPYGSMQFGTVTV